MATTKPSSAYSPLFLQLFLKVVELNKDVAIKTLPENTKSAYTTLRARLNEFRYAYREEAQRADDPIKLQIANDMYAVVLCNPEQVEGKWQIVLRPRGYKYVDALQATLAEVAEEAPAQPAPSKAPAHGAAAIANFLNDLPEE